MMHGPTPHARASTLGTHGLIALAEPGAGVALGFLVGWLLGAVVLRRVEDSMSFGAGA